MLYKLSFVLLHCGQVLAKFIEYLDPYQSRDPFIDAGGTEYDLFEPGDASVEHFLDDVEAELVSEGQWVSVAFVENQLDLPEGEQRSEGRGRMSG
jgi:hypothetical protein